ncbi:hypothetical protein MTR_0014s0350 [Medicago truncatula]|uniref:Uncharacterized protein n=1 Tax=Medicago truncatula TaxID=3880 RepID=A0A072TJX3_MEDTR|nr:hypothetical protein MTR_0014s0350 [Medicago truncatula]
MAEEHTLKENATPSTKEPHAIIVHPTIEEVGMYEVSPLDHLAAKVDALSQKFDKRSISVVSPAPVSPPCEVSGIFGHTGVECQLGSCRAIFGRSRPFD